MLPLVLLFLRCCRRRCSWIDRVRFSADLQFEFYMSAPSLPAGANVRSTPLSIPYSAKRSAAHPLLLIQCGLRVRSYVSRHVSFDMRDIITHLTDTQREKPSCHEETLLVINQQFSNSCPHQHFLRSYPVPSIRTGVRNHARSAAWQRRKCGRLEGGHVSARRKR